MTHAVFVVGGTGKVGHALIESLRPDAAAGRISLRIGTRTPEARRALAGRGIEFIKVDLDARFAADDLAAALAGCQALFLLTGYSVEMLVQSKSLLDAARTAGVRHVVHVGVHASESTFVPHIGWHQYIERYIECLGFTWTHLRPNWFMQNLFRFVHRTHDESLVIRNYLPSDFSVSWIDAQDIGGVAASILRNPTHHQGRTYPLATEASSFSAVADTLSRSLNVSCRYEELDLANFSTERFKAPNDLTYQASVLTYLEGLRRGLIPECAEVFDVGGLLGHAPSTLESFALRNAAALLAA